MALQHQTLTFGKCPSLGDCELQLATLFEEAFPIDERRPTLHLLQLIAEKTVDCFVATMAETFVGFLTIWEFGTFRYCEYFAIKSDFRNAGVGTKFLAHILKMSDKPLILEVEPPTDKLTCRRVAFYQRNGGKLCQKSYIQPAYTPNSQPIPLQLMEFGGKNLLDEKFNEVVVEIHRKVYLVEF